MQNLVWVVPYRFSVSMRLFFSCYILLHLWILSQCCNPKKHQSKIKLPNQQINTLLYVDINSVCTSSWYNISEYCVHIQTHLVVKNYLLPEVTNIVKSYVKWLIIKEEEKKKNTKVHKQTAPEFNFLFQVLITVFSLIDRCMSIFYNQRSLL